jgi:hypothetical protein
MALQNVTQLFAPSVQNESVPSKNLGEEFIFCENGNMVFHWADFYETCDAIKNQLETDAELKLDLKRREDALNRLKEITIWVRTEKKVHQSSMFDLYEKFILDQSHLLGGVDPFCPLEVSFISATGPFKGMSVAECFNHLTYRDFVMLYLIKNKLPKRDFRVRVKSKILVEHGNQGNAELVSLEQLGGNGILLSMKSETYLKKISEGECINLLINTKILADGNDLPLNELKDHLSQYTFNLLYSSSKDDSISIKVTDLNVQSSFDFSRNKKVFLFASYDKMQESNSKGVKAISDFVGHTKSLVQKHYETYSKKNKSA